MHCQEKMGHFKVENAGTSHLKKFRKMRIYDVTIDYTTGPWTLQMRHKIWHRDAVINDDL